MMKLQKMQGKNREDKLHISCNNYISFIYLKEHFSILKILQHREQDYKSYENFQPPQPPMMPPPGAYYPGAYPPGVRPPPEGAYPPMMPPAYRQDSSGNYNL
jgi:hypothetical protein